MKKIIAIAVCAAASSLYVPSVFAQTAAPAPSSAAKPMHKQHRYSVEEEIQRLHKELKITPSQEAQWGQVAQAMRDNAAQMKQVFLAQRGKRDSMTAIELLNNYSTIIQTHADGIKKVTGAFVPLYNSMPSDQKAVADKVFRNYRPYGRPGKPAGRPGKPGWHHHQSHAQHQAGGSAAQGTPAVQTPQISRQAH